MNLSYFIYMYFESFFLQRIRKKKRKCRKYVCDDNEFIKRIIDKMKEYKEVRIFKLYLNFISIYIYI